MRRGGLVDTSREFTGVTKTNSQLPFEGIGTLLFDQFSHEPERPFLRLRTGDEWKPPLTGEALLRLTHAAACAMRERGVKAGDHILIAIDKDEALIAAILGAVAVGARPAVTMPLPAGMSLSGRMGEERRRLLDQIAASHVVCDPQEHTEISSDSVRCIDPKVLTVPADSSPMRPSAVEPDSPCLLQFTSGSTGVPRAVVVSHQNVLANALALSEANQPDPDKDLLLAWQPLYHDMGLQGGFFWPLIARFQVAQSSALDFVRRPLSWLSDIPLTRATMITAPHFAYTLVARRLAKAGHPPQVDLSAVRVAFNGGEPVEHIGLQHFREASQALGMPATAMAPCFGLGEGTLAITLGGPNEELVLDRVAKEPLRRGLAVPCDEDDPDAEVLVGNGKATLGNQVRIVDPSSGETLPDRRVGEIVVKGVSVCSGYYAAEDSESQTFRAGHLHTGDLGYLVDGELFVAGRLKDTLIIYGQKYSPQHLEWAAETVAGVRPGRCAAFGVMDPGAGTESAVVICEIQPKASSSESLVPEITKVIRERTGLSPYVVVTAPGTVKKTSSGKIRRQTMRELYRAGKIQPLAPTR